MPELATLNKTKIGDSGANQKNSGNTIEFLSDLQGADGSLNFYKMWKSDGTAGMLVRAYQNPIRSCNWDLIIDEDADDATKDAGKVIRQYLFNDSPLSWSKLITQIISMIPMGFSAFENVWSIYENEGQKLLMPDLQQRLQTSLDEIDYEARIVKQTTTNKGDVEIPLDNMVFFVLDQEGSDLRGQSILRSAYRDYKRKLQYQEIMGIGIQRDAAGIPSMKVPSGIDTGSKAYKAAQELLDNLATGTGGTSYMIYPDGYEFKIEQGKFNSISVKEIIKEINSEMAASCLTQFLLLGQSGASGSFGLSRDQSDMFLDGLQYVIDLIEEVFNTQVLEKIVAYNFPNVDINSIKLKGLNLNKKSGEEHAEAVERMIASGLINPNVQDEIVMRKRYGLPDLTDDQIKKSENKKEEEEPIKEEPIEKETVKLSEKTINSGWKTSVERVSVIKNETEKLEKFMRLSMGMAQEKLLADIRRTLNNGSNALTNLKRIELQGMSKYKETFKKKLAFMANKSWNNAKKNASVKLAEEMNPSDLPSAELASFVINVADQIVDRQAEQFQSEAILTANSTFTKGGSIDSAVANAEKVTDNWLNSAKFIPIASELSVVNMVNFGEYKYFKSIEDDLWGYRFSNHDPKTNICKSLVGKTYHKSSSALADIMPPLHPRCKSFVEPIYKSEMKPEFDDYIPAPSIMKEKTIY